MNIFNGCHSITEIMLKTEFITIQSIDQFQSNPCFNPLPDMPILGSSNSAANKDMMSKYGQTGIQLLVSK